jgi:DNA repair exonuclease SbcCD ATPase subunit
VKLFIKSAEIKNFLSVGSQPITIEYKSGIHAVTGHVVGQPTNNGVGKSTLFVDAVVFAFFGKSIRGLNKAKMINSINDCDCYVHLRFEIDGHPYRIERGIKPDYLRLIDEVEEEENKNKKKNEKEDKEKSAKKLTQSDIDEKLGGMSLESFKNMITLNINYSTPFFKMSVGQKRDLLENIMNLSVFGRMFEKVKEDYNGLKRDIKELESDIKHMLKSYTDRVNTFKKLETMKKEFEESKAEEIEEFNAKILELENKKKSISIPDKDFESIRDKINSRLQSIASEISKNEHIVDTNDSNIRKNNKKIERMKESPVCSVCNNPTDSEHSAKHEAEINEENEGYQTAISEAENNLKTLKEEKDQLREKLTKAKEAVAKVEKLKLNKQKIDNYLSSYKERLEKAQSKEFDIEVIDKNELIKDKKELEDKKAEYAEVKKKFKLADRMKQILGDGGIKNYTIRKILPYLNKKMNQHLAMLNANYTISFDSQLKELLKSRNRDEFTYENFSGGEQKRIDIAWMFTTVSVAKMRNSVDCNLLVLDEVLDSSMCSNGIGMLMKYLKTEFRQNNSDHCVYIITHKSEIGEDDFDSIIRLKKENGFTKIDSIEELDPVIQV